MSSIAQDVSRDLEAMSIKDSVVAMRKRKRKPHQNVLKEFTTIKWIKSRVSDKVVKKAIFDLLPNKGEPIIAEEDKTPNFYRRKFLDSYMQPEDKFKNHEIDLRYLFPTLTLDKIEKLKQIFLEFDEDGSSFKLSRKA